MWWINGFLQKWTSKKRYKAILWQLRSRSSGIAFSLFLPILLLPCHSLDKQLDILRSWIGQTENKGANRSELIDKMNRYVGNPPGTSYCAAAQCYAEYLAGRVQFKTGLARNMRNDKTFSSNDVLFGKRKIKRGYYIIWQKGDTIYGHIEITDKDWAFIEGSSIGANTSPGDKGSQSNGDGIYERWRKIQPSSYSKIRWITPNE